MAEPKTKKTRASGQPSWPRVPDPERRKDARAVAALLRRVTGQRAVLWGTNIVGFGHYQLQVCIRPGGRLARRRLRPARRRIPLYVTCELSRHRPCSPAWASIEGQGLPALRRLSDVDPARARGTGRSAVADDGDGD